MSVRQLGAVVGGGTPSRNVTSFWQGETPWATPREVSGRSPGLLWETSEHITASALSASGANMLPTGSLMITTRATLGARAINAVPMATNQGFKSIIFDRPEDAWFYLHAFEKVTPEISRRASGTTFLEISGAEFGAIQLPSPPRVEKRKIAEILDTLDTVIHASEALIAKLKAVKQGLLHDLLTRGIDANGELRPSRSEAPHLYKASPLGWIPEEWCFDSISNLTVSSVIGPFGSDLVSADYRMAGVPIVFVRDIKPDRVIWKSGVFIDAKKALELSAHEVVSGDVVATKMGFPPCVAAVYPESMPNGVVTADIVRLRPDCSRIFAEWMSIAINSNAVVNQVEKITAGVTRPKVTLRDVRDLCLVVPPLEEQQKLLDRIDAFGRRVLLEDAKLRKLSAEKSGLMDDLLTGRVRVTPLLDAATA